MRGPLVLVGLMGSGKTRVGTALAALLGWPHLDLDAALEARYGRSVAEQFAVGGEALFRRREAALLRASRRRRCVLSTGGGVVLKAASRTILKAHCTVYLQASPGTLARRLDGQQARKRPLLKGKQPIHVLRELSRKRGRLYRQVARLTVRASEGGPEAVALRIARRLNLLS